MNIPPETFVRVPGDALRDLAVRLGVAAGLPPARAELLADLLTANDLRGVISHGTSQLATYVRLLRDGILNPDPRLEVVRETPTSLLVDGDGGLGYFPAHEGTRLLITKAEDAGIAVLVDAQPRSLRCGRSVLAADPRARPAELRDVRSPARAAPGRSGVRGRRGFADVVQRTHRRRTAAGPGLRRDARPVRGVLA